MYIQRVLAGAVASAMLLAAGAGVAKADVVTFDDPVGVANANTGNTPMADQGLVFSYTAGFGGVWGPEDPSQGNGTLNYIYAFGDGLTITRQGGGLFDLATADFTLSWYTAAFGGPFDPGVTMANDNVTLTAQTIGGPVVETLTLGQGFQTYGLGLTGVSSILITANSTGEGYWAVDNLEGANFGVGVPEPATWALMLVGFGGLGAALRLRRRERAISAAA